MNTRRLCKLIDGVVIVRVNDMKLLQLIMVEIEEGVVGNASYEQKSSV